MRIGVCTTDFERVPLNALLDNIASLGYEHAQFSFDSITESGFAASGQLELPPSVDDSLALAVAEGAKRRGLRLIALNGTYNMAHPDSAVRAEGARRFARLTRTARLMGCQYVSICTGTRDEDYLWRAHPDNASESAWHDMLAGAREIAAAARENGVKLAIEAEASNVVDTPEKAKALIELLGADAACAIMDCANLFHAGEARPECVKRVIGHAFDLLGPYVALAHGKDIIAGAGIAFCEAGGGIVDFAYFLGRLRETGYDGDLTLHGASDAAGLARALAFARNLPY